MPSMIYIINLDYGVPQMRERVYFVGIKRGLCKRKFKQPRHIKMESIENYLCDDESAVLPTDDMTFNKYFNNKYNKRLFSIRHKTIRFENL